MPQAGRVLRAGRVRRAGSVVQLGREFLPAQRLLHEVRGVRGRNQTPPLGPVGGEHRVQPAHRKHAAKFGPGGAVSLACPLHTGGQVTPGQRRERNGMAPQDPMQPVVGRDHVQQPCHGGPLEVLAARRVDPGWPSVWQIGDHTPNYSRFIEQMF